MRTAAMDDYFFNEIKSHPCARGAPAADTAAQARRGTAKRARRAYLMMIIAPR